MSIRSEIAEKIAHVIREGHLCNPYGGDVQQQTNLKGKPYNVGFSKTRCLDGEVTVYSDKFIRVLYQTTYRDLPHNDSRVFDSVENVITFIKLAFIEAKYQEALAIPQKQSKSVIQ